MPSDVAYSLTLNLSLIVYIEILSGATEWALCNADQGFKLPGKIFTSGRTFHPPARLS
jgi:hypothetical protein